MGLSDMTCKDSRSDRVDAEQLMMNFPYRRVDREDWDHLEQAIACFLPSEVLGCLSRTVVSRKLRLLIR
jgi:hypothetical protein